VLEPLSGYLVLAQHLVAQGAAYAEPFNFGPHDDDARPVQWIVERLVQHWGHSARWQLDGGEHPHEAHYLKLDISKAKARLGWQPRWHLAQALDHIVTWHRAWLDQADMRALCLQQIAAYSTTPTTAVDRSTP
jgi:CDP-glucose 4,6-dehydratase